MAEERIKCPICAELIQPGAKKCRFCGEWLAGGREAKIGGVSREPPEAPEEEKEGEGYEGGAGESERKSPEPEPIRRVEPIPAPQKGRFPLLRIILFIAYIAIIAALVCSERTARQSLLDAKAEETLDPNGALFSYSEIVFKFPFSFSFIEAQEGLRRLCGSNKSKLPRPSWLDAIEDVLGKETTVCEVYPLLFVAWPACTLLLALVFLTRILRPGTALFVLVLFAIAAAGTVVQLSWYNRVLPEPIAKGLFEEPVVLYSVTYVLLVVTALMTLTATRKRKNRSPGKMAAASRG